MIGIDRYRTWSPLHNAVSDARGVLQVFTDLGFELIGKPLFDEMATGEALHHLVVDDLAGLGREDSLVLFFAGHGHTVTRKYTGTTLVKDGYIIPVDGDRPGGRVGTWLRLESWLTEVSRIPARHILVLLDACHSGIALGPILKWRTRGEALGKRERLDQLRVRRSRRIITSALDNELALDNGPMCGHSLFTGCLIEAMTGGLFAKTGQPFVTGSEIGHYVQRRVLEYPGAAQTPDCGALELDDRGELVMRIAADAPPAHARPSPMYPGVRVSPPNAVTISPQAAAIALQAAVIPPHAVAIALQAAAIPLQAAAIPPQAAAIPPQAAAIALQAAAIPPPAPAAASQAHQRSAQFGRWIGGATVMVVVAVVVGMFTATGGTGSASLLRTFNATRAPASADAKPPASPSRAATKEPVADKALADPPPNAVAANPGSAAIEARGAAVPATTPSCLKGMAHVPGATCLRGSPDSTGTKGEAARPAATAEAPHLTSSTAGTAHAAPTPARERPGVDTHHVEPTPSRTDDHWSAQCSRFVARQSLGETLNADEVALYLRECRR